MKLIDLKGTTAKPKYLLYDSLFWCIPPMKGCTFQSDYINCCLLCLNDICAVSLNVMFCIVFDNLYLCLWLKIILVKLQGTKYYLLPLLPLKDDNEAWIWIIIRPTVTIVTGWWVKVKCWVGQLTIKFCLNYCGMSLTLWTSVYIPLGAFLSQISKACPASR